MTDGTRQAGEAGATVLSPPGGPVESGKVSPAAQDAVKPRPGQGLRYLSVCSGIEAATVAWHPLGWRAAAFAEVEAFPAAVLAHHYPQVLNRGDMTQFKDWPDDAGIDLLVGGTPCQSFSVAGLRRGLDDPRGNLALVYLALAERYRPRWLVWENVPGVLSSGGGRDFGAILGALGQLGYGWAYRVLDAQFFGVPQRRRRVFLVGHLGGWGAAAAVLFEPEGLRGNPPPRRETGEDVAPPLAGVTNGGGGNGPGRTVDDVEGLVAHALRAEGFDASEDGTGRGTPIIPLAFSCNDDGGDAGEAAPTLRAGGAYSANSGVQAGVTSLRGVRRLTPRECERLQGFPDDYTLIPWRGRLASDGPRYKALGNSMAVPVMAWIGARVALCDAAQRERAA